MVDKTSAVQIILSVIGSGLLLFVLNNLNLDFNQPHLDITVYNRNPEYRTVVLNDGRSAATHVRLTLYFSDNLTSYRKSFFGENVTLKKDDPHTVVADIPRLTRGALVSIHAITNASANEDSDPYYVVSASYDQGSNVVSSRPKDNPFYNYGRNYIPSSIIILVGATILSAILFSLLVSYGKIRDILAKKRSKLGYGLIRDIRLVQETLNKDILSQEIFSHKMNIKPTILPSHFSRFEDYRRINEFYKSIRERDSYFLNNSFNDEILQICNQECLQIANDVLKNTNWREYIKRTKLKINAVKIIVTASILLLVPYSYFSNNSVNSMPLLEIWFEDFLYDIQTADIFESILYITGIGVIIFSIGAGITKFQLSHTKGISIGNGILHFFTVRKHGLILLFILSILSAALLDRMFYAMWSIKDVEENYLFFASASIAIIITLIGILLWIVIPKLIIKKKFSFKLSC